MRQNRRSKEMDCFYPVLAKLIDEKIREERAGFRLGGMDGQKRTNPEFLNHRAYRPWEIHAGRPSHRDDGHGFKRDMTEQL